MNGLEKQLRAAPNRYERQRLLLKAGSKILNAANKKAKPKAVQQPAPTPRANGWHSLQDLPRLLRGSTQDHRLGVNGLSWPRTARSKKMPQRRSRGKYK
jgi:hypothetical protein